MAIVSTSAGGEDLGTASPAVTIAVHNANARQMLICVILVWILALDGLDLQLLALTSPQIMREWAVGPLAFSPALAAALVGMAVGSPAGGWLGDRWGRKHALMASVAIFGAGTSATALVDHVTSLTLVRFICGLGFGAAAPNAVALATEWMPPRSHSRLVGILAIGVPCGGMLGAIVAGLIEPDHGWRACFLFAGALTGLGLLAIGLAVPESPLFLDRRGDRQRANDLVAHILGPDPVRHEQGAIAASNSPFPAPDPAKGVLRLNAGIWMAAFAANYVIYTVFNWFPSLIVGQGWPMAQALQASFWFNTAVVAGSILSGLLAVWFGTRSPMVAASSLSLGMFGAIGLVLHSAARGDTILYLALTMMGAGLGLGMFLSIVWTIATYGYPTEHRARGLGMMLLASRLGGILSVFGGGFILSIAQSSVDAVPRLMMALLVLALIGALIIDRHAKRRGV